MRGHDPERERAFFEIFKPYYDLEKRPNRRYGSHEYGLERMRPLARLGGNPEKALQIVHVAGTKGKGSTAFFLAALLESAGRRCGVFSSPHLATVRERFQVGGRLVSYSRLLRTARRFEACLRAEGLRPSLFEIMTVLALVLFREAGCDTAVLETGIGGSLDATNYVPEKIAAVITPVSFDHTELLGETLADIAGQKGGIIRPGVPVICAEQPYPEVVQVLRGIAAERGAPFHLVSADLDAGPWLGRRRLPLFQQKNFRTALTACRVLGAIPDPRRLRLPRPRGRCEVRRRRPPVVLDAAHNAHSAAELAAALAAFFPRTKFTIVLGIAPDKDASGIVAALRPVAAEFILTHPLSPKGSGLDALCAVAGRQTVPWRVVPEIHSTDLPPDRPLLFTGSFFTALIGERLFPPALRNSRSAPGARSRKKQGGEVKPCSPHPGASLG